MQKHLHFFLGIFVSAILAVPLYFGIIGASEEKIINAAVFGFGVMVALIFAMIVVLFLREKILRRYFRTEVLEPREISQKLHNAVRGLIEKDSESIRVNSTELVAHAVSAYAWTNFYKWVVATTLALLLAFAAFAGTILLFEQNRKLQEHSIQLKAQTEHFAEQNVLVKSQNELLSRQSEVLSAQNDLLSLNLTGELRGQLLNSVSATKPYQLKIKSDGCEFIIPHPETVLLTRPNTSTIAALSNMARNERWKERVINSLQTLLRDDNGRVSLGALLVLEDMKIAPNISEIHLRDMHVDYINIDSKIRVVFYDSVIDGFYCEKCKLVALNSIVNSIQVSIPASVSGGWLSYRHSVSGEFNHPIDMSEVIQSLYLLRSSTGKRSDLTAMLSRIRSNSEQEHWRNVALLVDHQTDEVFLADYIVPDNASSTNPGPTICQYIEWYSTSKRLYVGPTYRGYP